MPDQHIADEPAPPAALHPAGEGAARAYRWTSTRIPTNEKSYTAWAEAYITEWVGFDPSRFNGFHSYTKDGNGNILPNGGGKTGGCVALPPGESQAVYDFSFVGMRVEVHR
ncbi:MAG: L,D-transpeptidase [Chloroflexota bacterium]|nr:L,D-transpeptidase [Chloroflexota bacterium]